jgi:hypothetical protein
MPKGKRKRARAKTVPQSKPRRRRRKRAGGVLFVVRAARRDAAQALQKLREEIAEKRKALDHLVAEERSFIADISGRVVAAARSFVPGTRRRRARPVKRGPAKADRFFAKLPKAFTLDDVRKVAGRLSGVSLAQWSRAKKIQKTGSGYAKTA